MGASKWALGSQIWKKKNGILTKNIIFKKKIIKKGIIIS